MSAITRTSSPSLRDTLRPEDASRVARLLERTGMFKPEEVAIALELLHDFGREGTASGYQVLLAEAEDRLAGYACFGPTPLTLQTWDLYWIAVDPAHQGRGVGRCLLREAEDRIARQGGAAVYVDTSGQPRYQATRDFYRSCGYHEAARLDDFYAPGDPKVIFAKRTLR